MDASLLIGLEMAGVLGLALAWGGYELWSLRRWRERDRKERDRREREVEAAGDRPDAASADEDHLR